MRYPLGIQEDREYEAAIPWEEMFVSVWKLTVTLLSGAIAIVWADRILWCPRRQARGA